MRWLAKGETPAWRRLTAPLRYLSINHEIKPRYDWGWPFLLTVVTMSVFWILPLRPSLLGENGVLKGIQDLIALLAAFYVVALAAVATFSLETLDRPMEGTTPRLGRRDLSRRQFVCYLFGYLAFLSFALFLGIVAARIVTPSLAYWLSPKGMWWVRGVCGTAFTFAFWNMIVTTLLGIYFLVERVHLNKPANGEPEESGRRPKPGRRAA